MINIDYKDTEKKLEVKIFDLPFEINKKELENIDTKQITGNDNLEEIIDKVIGQGAVDKINKKRKQDGYDVMDTQVELTILTFITETYVDSSIRPINRVVDKYNNYNRKFRRNNRYRRY